MMAPFLPDRSKRGKLDRDRRFIPLVKFSINYPRRNKIKLFKFSERGMWKARWLLRIFLVVLSVYLIRILYEVKKSYRFVPQLDNYSQMCDYMVGGHLKWYSYYTPLPDLTTDDDVLQIAEGGCEAIFERYSFITDLSAISEEEKDYPLAFVIVTHRNTHQLMHLLSAIYRPHNAYCIHIDWNAPSLTYMTIEKVVQCLPNVHLASKRERVIYASIYLLKAHLNCMSDLYNVPQRWNHLINMCGMDYPIQTNLEIIRQIKNMGLQGKNAIHGILDPKQYLIRTQYVYRIVRRLNNDGQIESYMDRTKTLKSPPPYGIPLRKSFVYNLFSREFLYWVLFKSVKANALLKWLEDTLIPEEQFFIMLDSLEEAPGRTGYTDENYVVMYAQWDESRCYGYMKHYSCIFGARDVADLSTQKFFIANKFDMLYDALPILCMQRELRSRLNLFYK